jgi:hypothetical protein
VRLFVSLFVCYVSTNTLSSSYTNPVNRSEIKLITGQSMNAEDSKYARKRQPNSGWRFGHEISRIQRTRESVVSQGWKTLFASACPKIISCTHGNFEEQKKGLESSIIIINYCIITAYYNYNV